MASDFFLVLKRSHFFPELWRRSIGWDLLLKDKDDRAVHMAGIRKMFAACAATWGPLRFKDDKLWRKYSWVLQKEGHPANHWGTCTNFSCDWFQINIVVSARFRHPIGGLQVSSEDKHILAKENIEWCPCLYKEGEWESALFWWTSDIFFLFFVN